MLCEGGPYFPPACFFVKRPMLQYNRHIGEKCGKEKDENVNNNGKKNDETEGNVATLLLLRRAGGSMIGSPSIDGFGREV